MPVDDYQTYLFCDLETTGINPEKNEIIEIACILTRGLSTGFEEIDRYSTFVATNNKTSWQREALETHRKSGLLYDYGDGKNHPDILTASQRVKNMIAAHKRPVFAARNPHFDRGFVREKMKLRIDGDLHYRQFDVTTVCTIDPSLYDYDHGVEGTPHRAMYDVERDLEYVREFVRRYDRTTQ